MTGPEVKAGRDKAARRRLGPATIFGLAGLCTVVGAYLLSRILPMASGLLFEVGFWSLVLALAAVVTTLVRTRSEPRKRKEGNTDKSSRE